jgi:signal transduction histidine kinase
MNGNGTLTLKISANISDNEVCLDIIDTGSGICEESLDLIFDPFFTTKGHDNGTGLGLYVSQSIIQHHNGRIFVKESSKKGTVISIHLPVNRERVAMAVEQELSK